MELPQSRAENDQPATQRRRTDGVAAYSNVQGALGDGFSAFTAFSTKRKNLGEEKVVIEVTTYHRVLPQSNVTDRNERSES